MSSQSQLVHEAEEFLAAIKQYEGKPPTQEALLQKLDKIRYMIETPPDVMMRQWKSIHLMGAARLLLSLGALQKIPQQGTITAQEIGNAVGVDESVITRSMRLLCIEGIGEEPEPDTYAHNAKSLAYINGTTHDFFGVIVDQDHAFSKLPEYFKTHTRDDLFELKKCPYSYSKGLEGMTYYEAISADPARFTMFNRAIAQIEKQRPSLGMYPFAAMEERVKADTSRPFIVDIGGGLGQLLMSVQQEAPAGFGAPMILQDRAEVLDSIPDEQIPNVTKMEHDFFTPQPVKNAHLYIFRCILHDFYEPLCVDLLRNVVGAMGPTSRVLIMDFVVPEKTYLGAENMVYWSDFSMMILTGKEKTAKIFSEMFDAVGLEIVKIWPYGAGPHSVVEGKLKGS